MKTNKFFQKTIDKIKLLFHEDKEFCLMLYGLLGFVPGRLNLYRMALTHRSITSVHNRKLYNNERLEFLGDAVLSTVTADYLYKRYRKEREGFLSKSRSRLVCRESLNSLALEIGLDKLVNVGDIAPSHNSYIYGNAFEALVGAIYIDKGYETCRKYILDKMFMSDFDFESIMKSDNNYKSRLIEWSQKEHRDISFSLISEEQRCDGYYFVSEVYVDGELFGHGEGFSKRESQQLAAKTALQHLKNGVVPTDSQTNLLR